MKLNIETGSLRSFILWTLSFEKGLQFSGGARFVYAEVQSPTSATQRFSGGR